MTERMTKYALHIGVAPGTTEAITSMVKAALIEVQAGRDVDKVKADAVSMLLAGVTFTPGVSA